MKCGAKSKTEPSPEAIASQKELLQNDYEHFDPNDPSMISIATELASISEKLNINDFKILKVIGRGSYGKVMLIQHKTERDLYALKILRKKKVIKTSQIEHTKSERK